MAKKKPGTDVPKDAEAFGKLVQEELNGIREMMAKAAEHADEIRFRVMELDKMVLRFTTLMEVQREVKDP